MENGIREQNLNEFILKNVAENISRGDFEKRMDELNFSDQETSLIWNLISVNLENSENEEHDVNFEDAMKIFNIR